MAEQSSPRTDSGSLLEDLRANARLVQATLTDPRQGALFRAVSAPLYYRLMISKEPVDVDAADRAAAAAVAAAPAGVFVESAGTVE